ncbi:MAG: Maf family protein [Alkalilacustris sp.]
MPHPLILASASAVRAELLRQAGVPFDVVPARVDEQALQAGLVAAGASPRDMADALAEQKARRVSGKHPDRLVLGCDQVLAFQDQVFGKPRNRAEAAGRLRALRGQTHALISAVVLYQGTEPVWRHVDTARLTMASFSDAYLDGYLDRGWPGLGSTVGGYRVEDEGIRLFSRIEGSHFSVLGLPLLPLLGHLGCMGVIDA